MTQGHREIACKSSLIFGKHIQAKIMQRSSTITAIGWGGRGMTRL